MTVFAPLRLGHVSLATDRLEEMIAFYEKVLGAQIAHEFRNALGERYGVFLATGEGTFIELFNSPDVPLVGNRFRHISFEVDDIDVWAAHLRINGYNAEVKRGRTDHILQFFITAPDGVTIEFQQHDEQSALAQYVNKR